MLTRQSTRINASRIEDDRGTESPGSRTNLRKRQKTAAANPRQSDAAIQGDKKGKRRAEFYYCGLAQMPLDILMSICSELEPIDLLQLLRVSKGFHDFLWLKTTAHVWRIAFENLPHPQRPPCPPDVNIIHYTNFTFGTYCQFCASHSTNQTKYDTVLLRLCIKCFKKYTMNLYFDKGDSAVHRLCHCFSDGAHILKVEYNLREKEMAQATKELTLSEYLEERRKAIWDRSQHVQQLRSWQQELTRLANLETTRIVAQRQTGMLNRLANEACFPQNLLWQIYGMELPHMREEHELTDDEWRNIRANVIEFLFDYSEKRLGNTTKYTLICRLEALDAVLQQFVVMRPRIAPTVLHVASWDPYSNLVKSSTGPDQTVNFVLGQIAMLPKHITQWRQKTDKYLIRLLPKSRRPKNRNDNPLAHATTFFRCLMCTEPITYPRILMHQCLLRPSGAKGDSIQRRRRKQAAKVPREPRPMIQVNADTVFPSLSETFGEGMHPGRAEVSFHKEASKSAREIILACGKNPDAITPTEMDWEDFRVQCLPCSSGTGKLVMRWTIAILHDLNKHGVKTQAQWRLVRSGADLEKIKQKEAEIVKNSDMPAQYCCCLCDQKVQKLEDRVGHLVKLHQWTRGQRNVSEQFYTDIDLTMDLPPHAIRI